MYIVCLDLESILVPEIWIRVAEETGIDELRLTTRDVPDYDFLMNKRLKILRKNNIKLKDLQKVIRKMRPYLGAIGFLNWLRKRCQVIILSDSFYEFVEPLLEKFSYPPIFCNSLEVDKKGFIKDYRVRQKDGKLKSIKALKGLGFKVIAVGDSFNDASMLKEANLGIFFKPSKEVRKKFLQFPAVRNYMELESRLKKYIE